MKDKNWVEITMPPQNSPETEVKTSIRLTEGADRDGTLLSEFERPLDPKEREEVLERFTTYSMM